MAYVETKEQDERLTQWTRFREMTREVHRGFIAEWTVTIILLLFATTTLVQAFVIPSASMEDTLLVGDHVLVDKLVFSPHGAAGLALPYRDVRRGDVIVFRYPLNIGEDYVKRAIGIPGDHIRFVSQQLILNGKPVKEPYVKHIAPYPDTYRDNFPVRGGTPLWPRAMEMLENHVVNGELVVPPGYIFAMGDNRDDSYDSRYWGFVPNENIIGTPILVYMSINAPEEAWDPGHIRDRMIAYASVLLHPSIVRWRRIFKVF